MTQNHFASSLESKNKMWIGVTTAAHLYRTNRDWEIGLRPRALLDKTYIARKSTRRCASLTCIASITYIYQLRYE